MNKYACIGVHAQTFSLVGEHSQKSVETAILEEESLKNTQPPGIALLFRQVI